MSDSLNVNVLVAAKDEYTKQLVSALQSRMYEILKGILVESQIDNKKNRISISKFQVALKGVPNWTDFKLEEKIKKTKDSYPYLMDLMTAVFVSHVKILACVRLSAIDKSIKIKVPNINTFLHKIIIAISEHVYYNPNIIDEGKEKIYSLIATCINDTIGNQIPIQFILSEYLSGVFDEDEPKDEPKDEPEDEPEDEQEDEPEDEPEEQDIPLVPIERPVEKIESGEDFLDSNEIKSFDELKSKKDPLTINKREDIEDSESESESESEHSDDDTPEEETRKSTLF